MRSCFRYHDRLYRFGGEEFVVVLRCGSDADAAVAFDRLRSTVQAYAFPQVGHLTVSVGYTEIRLNDTPSAAFERADQAVYWAKTHGRNRVCGFAELVVRGELNDESKAGDVELF
jgi:diguanylate cyclase (GGDEF)-like protein